MLTITFGYLLFKSIRRNTFKINQSILEIAKAGGDLTRRVEVKTKDEFALIANSTNILIESISNLIKRVTTRRKRFGQFTRINGISRGKCKNNR